MNPLPNRSAQVYQKWNADGWYTAEENAQITNQVKSNATYIAQANQDGTLSSEESAAIRQNARDTRVLVGQLAWNGDY